MSIFYITAWGHGPDCGIYRCEIDHRGRVLPVGFNRLRGAGYLAWSVDRRTIYATALADETAGAVAAFAVGGGGELRPLGTLPSSGRSCCHLAAAPGGRFLYAANYATGSLVEFSLRPDGSIAGLTRLIEHHGSGPDPERQEGAHVHFTLPTPDGRYIAVCDLGCDTVSCYRFDPEHGLDPDSPLVTVVPPGRGPRHLAFHPSGRFAFIVTELGNTLISCRYADGQFEFIDEQTLLPDGVNCYSKASAVRISPDGRFVLASNRGFDSVASFPIAANGRLGVRRLTLSGGSSPREMNFLPGGRFFAVANEFSGEVRIFTFNSESGTLEPGGCRLELPRPLGIIF